MDAKHQELIRTNYTSLIANLRESDGLEKVCNFLYKKKIITLSNKEKVLYQKTPGRMSSYFLDVIVNKGARAFGAFYEACKQNGLTKSADILRPDRAPHLVSFVDGSVVALAQEEQEHPLPETWPSREHHSRVNENKLIVKKVPKDEKSAMLKRYQSKMDDMYPMCHEKRGNALIILNSIFTYTNLDQRKGSEWDELGLTQLFEGLGFNVITKKNLDKGRIFNVIDAEISKDCKDYDAFVLFVLSYGKQGAVLDKYGHQVSIRSIIDRVYEAENLKDKPKLIFFQACQGGEGDTGNESVVEEAEDESNNDVNLNEASVSSDSHDHAAGVGGNDLSIPQYEDVFLFRSSPDGNLSHRNVHLGSWFTQAVIYVFSEFAYKCEIGDLQLKINDLLSKAETAKTKYKNIGEFSFVPGKKFYFFPGLYTIPNSTTDGN